ncbi:MAG TPA: shikimate dehydrogenase [Anaerolineales bacterium]|nr:shikimate dehydrogenase [Anaerolineales bacterium]
MPDVRLGLIGYPLGHSLSPLLHQAALDSVGLAGEYLLFPISPQEAKQGKLKELLAEVRRGRIYGLNVTIPYKQMVIPMLDRLTETAAAIGAVNTIYLEEGLLVGDNTDAPGFFRDLQNVSQLLTGHEQPSGICLLLGAGGAARAIAYSLIRQGWQVRVAARRFAQAFQFSVEVKGDDGMSSAVTWPPRMAALEAVSLVVNATPLGMHPHTAQSPWPQGLPFPPGVLVYDLVYNPPMTALVTQARQAGLPAESGLGMLVHQAVLAFELWTGVQPNIEAMFEAAGMALKEKGK